MTISIVFMAGSELVLRLNMCFSSFEYKILDELTKEEIEKWVPEFDDDKTFTTKSLSKRFGTLAFVRHRYISEDYDILGKFLDKMEDIL